MQQLERRLQDNSQSSAEQRCNMTTAVFDESGESTRSSNVTSVSPLESGCWFRASTIAWMLKSDPRDMVYAAANLRVLLSGNFSAVLLQWGLQWAFNESCAQTVGANTFVLSFFSNFFRCVCQRQLYWARIPSLFFENFLLKLGLIAGRPNKSRSADACWPRCGVSRAPPKAGRNLCGGGVDRRRVLSRKWIPR